MSPFSKALKDLRNKRKLLQKDAAEILGYEQSYLSALEVGLKGLPKKPFLKTVVSKFNLSEVEQRLLWDAYAQSKRYYALPTNASAEEYKLCHLLELQLGKLLPQQIDLITIALSIGKSESLQC